MRFLNFYKKNWSKTEQFTYFETIFLINKSKIWLKVLHNLQEHLSHFHFLIFSLNSSREAASLCSDGIFAQRDGDMYVIVSIP